MSTDGLTAAADPAPAASIEARVQLPRVGIGLAPLGGLYRPVTSAEALTTLATAWERGFRYYDVAPLYGNGSAEQLLARAGEDWAEPYAVSTKVGRVLRPGGPGDGYYFSHSPLRARFDFTGKGIRQSLEESLQRLQRDSVDVAFVHDPDDAVETAIDQSLPELVRLRDEGMVRAIGVGMNQWQAPLRILQEFPLDAILLAGRYTLLDQSGALLLEECRRRGTAVIAAGVFNSGALAAASTGELKYDYKPADPEIGFRVEQLRRACTEFDVPLRTAALHFPASHPTITTTLVGVRTPDEVEQLHRDLCRPVPPGLWRHLQDAGLIDEQLVLTEDIGGGAG